MPIQDYVNRKLNTSKATSNSPKHKITLIVIFGIATISIATAYKIQQKPVPTFASSDAENEDIVEPSNSLNSHIAPLPEATWWYESELPNYTIEITPNNGITDSTIQVMQCGAFKSLAQANRQASLINARSLHTPARVLQREPWHLVSLGPYPSRRSAEKDRHTLQRAGIEPCVIRAIK